MPSGYPTYGNTKIPWSDAEIRILHDHYAQRGPAFCAELLAAAGHPARRKGSVGQKGKKLGLTYQGPHMTPYHPGMAAFNKGQPMSADKYAKCAPTMFKKGNRTGAAARKYQPIGTEKFLPDGYWYIKTREGGRWERKHRVLWEQHHGPIPAGMILRFRDGNPHNITLQNLELITRAEHARRNRFNQPATYSLLTDRPAKIALKKQGFRTDEIRGNPALLKSARVHTLLHIQKRNRHA